MRPRTSPPTAYGAGARRRTSTAGSPAPATPRATPATSAGVHRLPCSACPRRRTACI